MVTQANRSAALLAALVAAATVIGACGAQGDAGESAAVVRYVVDGDTLRLRDGSYVRLLQIDAPERGEECYAGLSTRELTRLTPPGSRVVLETDPGLDRVDRYGRLLRYVRTGVNVNIALVRRGAATPYFYDGDRGRYASRLLEAMADARAERRGMWGACRVLWAPDRPVTTRPR